jgi:hypothetical protein
VASLLLLYPIPVVSSFHGVLAVVGIVLSVIGRNQAKRQGLPHRRLAVAGIVIGVFSLFALFLLLLVAVALWSDQAASPIRQVHNFNVLAFDEVGPGQCQQDLKRKGVT